MLNFYDKGCLLKFEGGCVGVCVCVCVCERVVHTQEMKSKPYLLLLNRPLLDQY